MTPYTLRLCRCGLAVAFYTNGNGRFERQGAVARSRRNPLSTHASAAPRIRTTSGGMVIPDAAATIALRRASSVNVAWVAMAKSRTRISPRALCIAAAVRRGWRPSHRGIKFHDFNWLQVRRVDTPIRSLGTRKSTPVRRPFFERPQQAHEDVYANLSVL